MQTHCPSSIQEKIQQAHNLYCELTSQKVLLVRFNRQRQWYELLRYGFTLNDIKSVIKYLQDEIKEGRRNIGALKLSNLLEPDKFEEDLNISRASLSTPKPVTIMPEISHTPHDLEQQRKNAEKLSIIRQKILAIESPKNGRHRHKFTPSIR